MNPESTESLPDIEKTEDIPFITDSKLINIINEIVTFETNYQKYLTVLINVFHNSFFDFNYRSVIRSP